MSLPFTQQEFSEVYPRKPPQIKSWSQKVKSACSCDCSVSCLKEHVKKRVPVLEWLPAYKWREHLLSDVVAGVSVGIFHIPQGMAFAMLALLPPYHGIYMGIFPVIMYALLGTSPHASTGSFAVVLLMASTAVDRLRNDEMAVLDSNKTITVGTTEPIYGPVEINTALALMVGLWQIVLGLLQFGSLTVLLSDCLVSGFTCGAAVHVATSQVPGLLGITVTRYSGPFKIIYTWIDICKSIPDSNVATVVISLIAITILHSYNTFLKNRWDKRMPCPLPVELLVVVLATVVSYYMHLNTEYDVKIAGYIPSGLPSPVMPPTALLSKIVVDSLTIAIVAYAINYSVERLFANKQGYNIDATQEFYAHGMSNVIGGFFLCGPSAIALARAVVQFQSGAKTQATGIFTGVTLIIVLLGLAPYFKTLPSPVLSAVVVVSLKSMLMQITDLKTNFSRSFMDGMIWSAAFFGVFILDIDYGLGLAILAAIIVLIYRSQKPKTYILGSLPETDIFVDISSYPKAQEIPDVKIFHFAGGLHFANKSYYKKQLLKLTLVQESTNNSVTSETSLTDEKPKVFVDWNYLVLDCSGITFIDSDGAKTIVEMAEYFKKKEISVILVSGQGHVVEKLERCGTLKTLQENGVLLCPTVSSAVAMIQQENTDL